MSSKCRRAASSLRLAAALVGAGALNAVAWSAEGGPESGAAVGSLEEVVVTAEKRESTVQKTPISITAFSGPALEAQGVAAKDAAVRLKQHPYYVGKLYAQGRNYTPEELRSVTVRLADLDHAIKGGSRLAGELELERALIEITAPSASG